MAERMRVLVGIVGYRNLRDFSSPFAVLERLEAGGLGPDVTVEDVSYNPIAVVQWLQSELRFDRAVLVAAVERNLPPGSVSAWRWDGVLPPEADVQQAVAEAVTGVIALENTLLITGYFKALPPEVAIVGIEPLEHAFGAGMSPNVRTAVERACACVRALAGGAPVDRLAALPARAAAGGATEPRR